MGTVTIYCTGALADFLRVDVDGVTVDSSYYTLEEGSTILTFKVAYLNTLSEGDHTVVMHYTNDRSVQMTLTIHESDEVVLLMNRQMLVTRTSRHRPLIRKQAMTAEFLCTLFL